MRATVMESRDGKSVILTEDGMFRTVKGNYQVGWEFDYKVPISSNRKMTSRIAAAAACLFMMLSMGTYSYQNLMVYATVTLNGTAPIQLELNRQDKVIGVKAIDASGEALAEQLLDSGIKGEYFENAVAKAEQMMKAQKDDGQTTLLPQVQCKSADKLKDLASKLHKETPVATAQEASPSTEPSGTTAATTAEDPEKKTEISAQSGAEEKGSTEASATTQPSSSEEGMSSQEEPAEEMTSQEETDNMDAQEMTETMTAQEAPAADAGQTADPAPAAADKAPAPAPAADETPAADTAADEAVE